LIDYFYHKAKVKSVGKLNKYRQISWQKQNKCVILHNIYTKLTKLSGQILKDIFLQMQDNNTQDYGHSSRNINEAVAKNNFKVC
jgi:hypothetical protein